MKTVKANSKGVAQVHLKSGKHTWRARVSATGTVWGSHTGAHKK